MELLKGANVLVRFLLELCLLVVLGYWGFKMYAAWSAKIILGIGLPVVVAVVWGLFVAPKAAHPLQGLPRIALEMLLLGLGVVALFASGKPGLASAYALVLVLNEVLLLLWRQ